MTTTNGQQITGTVHVARVTTHSASRVEVLSPFCQKIGSATRCYLAETSAPVTCKRCVAKVARLAASAAKHAAVAQRDALRAAKALAS